MYYLLQSFKYYRSVPILILLLVFTIVAEGRQYQVNIQEHHRLAQLSVDNWGTDDGLPSNTVLGITQTPDGFLWLASYDGLTRFDGMQFKNYGKRTSKLFNTNVAFDIASSADSTLWVGTHGSGLLSYKNNQLRPHGISELFIQSIVPDDKTQSIWVAARDKGLLRYHWDSLRWQGKQWDTLQCPFSANPMILDLALGSQGDLWIATVSDGLLRYAEGQWQQFEIPAPMGVTQTRCLFFDKKRRLWIGTGNGLLLFDDGKLIEQEQFKGLLVHHINQDASGLFWVGTLQGLIRWNSKTQSKEWLRNRNGQYVTDVYDTHQDFEGSIWIASYRHGLYRIKDSNFSNYNYSGGEVITHPITAITEYEDSSYLAGNSQGKLFKFENHQLSPFPIKTVLPKSKIYQMIRDREGTIWVATFHGILSIKKNGVEKFFQAGSIQPEQVHAKSLCEDMAGNIWIGTFDDGLLQMTKQGKLLARYSANRRNFPSNYIMSVKQQPNGTLVIGTNDQGVVLLDPASKSIQHYSSNEGLSSNLIFNTHTDAAGMIWIATNGGISCLKKTGEMLSFTYQDGLPYDNPFDFVEDPMGNAWLPTSRGIIKVAKASLLAYAAQEIEEIHWEIFDKRDGINYEQCTGAAFAHVDSSYNIWFPSIGGLIRVNPHKMAYNSFKPPVYINALTVDGQKVDFRKQAAKLSSESQHYIFDYTALSLWAPSKVQFKYKIEGYDRIWIDAGNQRSASYTNLPSGWHTFHVIASNNDGVWNKEGAKLRFFVRAHFYESWWFYGLAFVTILSLFCSFYYLRVKVVKRRNDDLEKKVQLRTMEIAQQQQEIEQKNLEIAAQNTALEGYSQRLLKLNDTLKKSNSNLEDEVGVRTLALNEAMDKLNASSKELNNFIYQAPHDFRGPIARIMGILNVARMEAGDQKMPHIDKLFKVAQEMDAMLTKLMKVHDVIGTHQCHYQAIDFTKTYQNCLNALSKRFVLDNYDINFEYLTHETLYTDAVLLEVILESLIENSLTYTMTHSEQRNTIKVRYQKSAEGKLQLEVWDNGIGIPPKLKSKVFHAFFKASERSQGNGLGLYLVRKSLNKIQASIEISSEVGEYTSMVITFPNKK